MKTMHEEHLEMVTTPFRRVFETKRWRLPGMALTIVLTVALSATVSAAADPLIRHVVVEPATDETPRSDTASVVKLADGRLMAVYHKYEAGEHAGRDQGLCRIWSKTSADRGRTWEEPRMLVDVAEGDMNVQAPGLLRTKSGTLLMNCLRAHKSGASSTMCLFASTDEGKTFVEKEPIWTVSKGQLLQGGASSLLELGSGRLLLPFHGGTGNQWKQKNSAWCLRSDDGGKTWQRSNAIELPKRGAMEASVAELAHGQLLMSLRTQLGGPYLSRSLDGGITWTEPVFSGLEGGESCTCLRRMPGTNEVVLFWNHSKYDVDHHHYGERTPLTAAISSDAGKSWRVIGNIADDPEAEYTNLDCFFTSKGDAILTYMYAKPAWGRDRISLRAALIPRTWFNAKPDSDSEHDSQD
jgi:sialidase-1